MSHRPLCSAAPSRKPLGVSAPSKEVDRHFTHRPSPRARGAAPSFRHYRRDPCVSCSWIPMMRTCRRRPRSETVCRPMCRSQVHPDWLEVVAADSLRRWAGSHRISRGSAQSLDEKEPSAAYQFSLPACQLLWNTKKRNVEVAGAYPSADHRYNRSRKMGHWKAARDWTHLH